MSTVGRPERHKAVPYKKKPLFATLLAPPSRIPLNIQTLRFKFSLTSTDSVMEALQPQSFIKSGPPLLLHARYVSI
ncbi:MAG TPA: hypothetical protein VNZ55_13570, partial [Thermomicrobiales bacterium]|nr:hypothetical protein [Thermomicrobiales bacterium]